MIIYGEPSIGLLITIVIVVSIFIGVGIKNWLEDRKDKIKIELANTCVETEEFLNKQIEATYKVVEELNKVEEEICSSINSHIKDLTEWDLGAVQIWKGSNGNTLVDIEWCDGVSSFHLDKVLDLIKEKGNVTKSELVDMCL